ncbi:conserved hypothetical protein [Vibrio harveyi]|uniref:type III toxin-antitoxin system TenpIN family toxin n=1 Tax=Vibrio TaxID=662 RepID=UPI0004A4D990|nr:MULTISPECIES: hypothetical protein [Vibrio]CAH1235091.1 conserved hypothetical protein [Vibrio harveyi]CAH1546806.1 conserved hypothetical protein [Vibrio rotiferianus]CAH1608276.1 conserved hypothetical protein [Vibrio jasicida]CAH1576034.1 conserved hypothetical protein [Vibrio harveyi]CAH1578727.1 conserved hypothetical protein [Vibrio harveyi]
MKLRSMTDEAYQRLSEGRDQVLQKNRGYGVISVQVNDLTFAVPLRSNLNHPNGFKTLFYNGKWNGLDYSKALLVQDEDLNQEAFKPRNADEYKKIKNNEDKIIEEFGDYVSGYIDAAKEGKTENHKFKFTTLQYFHDELGI